MAGAPPRRAFGVGEGNPDTTFVCLERLAGYAAPTPYWYQILGVLWLRRDTSDHRSLGRVTIPDLTSVRVSSLPVIAKISIPGAPDWMAIAPDSVWFPTAT